MVGTKIDMQNTPIQDVSINLVTFRLGAQFYALPIEPIRQIIEMVTITPVPQVKDTIEGVINFHGAPVPVIDLRKQLALPPIPLQLHTPIILVNLTDRLVGLIVDEVMDVLSLPANQIVDPKNFLPDGTEEAPVLKGLVQMAGKSILCLDFDQLLNTSNKGYLLQGAETNSPGLLGRIKRKVNPNGKKPRKPALPGSALKQNEIAANQGEV